MSQTTLRSGTRLRHLRPQAAREAGSAYVVVLLALVVLTIIGLSLSLITQGEMQVGNNERTIQRVFYATDTGIAVAVSRALVNADYGSRTYELADDLTPAALNIRHQVEVSPFYPILDSPCNLCEINDAGSYSENSFRKINHALSVRATRVFGGDETPLARKLISEMVEVQPWKSDPHAYLPLEDPDELKKIKF